MGSLNLYRIDDSKKQTFIQELSKKMSKSKTTFIQKKLNVAFKLILFSSRTSNTKDVKWNWLLRQYDEEVIQIEQAPSAVLLIESDEQHTYAATYGHSYFVVDKYADRDFGFAFARKMLFDEIKTTTLTTPNSKRNKTVNTYIDYDELEFDSGESFAKPKAKVESNDTCALFKPSLEIGTSIRFVTETDSLDNIVSIICFIENTIRDKEDVYKIPVFSKVKDKDLISQLDIRMKDKIKKNPEISIPELDIIGATEVFNRNDSEYVIKYGRKNKDVISITNDELQLFCKENNFDFGNIVLDIQVQKKIRGKRCE